jgi:Na+/H+-dicarboxylate symporter
MSTPWRKDGKSAWLTIGSLIGLAAGFLGGAWAHRTGAPWLIGVSAMFAPVGTMWSNALRMTVTPLVAAQVVATLVGSGGAGPVGRIAGLSFLVFSAMLIAGGAVTVLTMPAILAMVPFSPAALETFRTTLPAPPPPPNGVAPGLGDWLIGVIPANPFRAAVQDDLLGVMVFAVLFGLAVAQMPGERRALVGGLARAVGEAMITVVGWIMWFMPVGVFALALASAVRGGFGAMEVIAVFVVLTCVVLLAWTLLMYPIAAIAGGVSIRRFARAVLPAQLVAVGTRSSIIALPSLLDGAQARLGLRPEVASLVMPLAVSTFKTNRSISSTMQFVFLAYVSGVALTPGDLATFMAVAVLLSFSTVGIPSGGSQMRTLPLYIAAGIPAQAYLLTEAADTIPDIFKTLLNVTGNMTAAAVVNRFSGDVVGAPRVEAGAPVESVAGA